jgi:nitroreductase
MNLNNLIRALNWRYATKRMNHEKVPAAKLENILEAIRLAPSSMGLQPYSVLVVEDPELRKKIRAVANNQPQLEEGSHVLIFAAWDKITPEKADDYIQLIAEARGIPKESLAGFAAAVNGRTKLPGDAGFNWAARQAYIAFGIGIAAAALEEVDATPMEGFNADALNELLGLREKGLRSVVMLVLGYRDVAADPLAHAKKVRRDKSNLFVELKPSFTLN